MKRILTILILIVSLQIAKGQNLGNFDGILNTNNYYEKVLNISAFPNGTSNLAVDIVIGNVAFWGSIEVEIAGSYNYQNAAGKLVKIFAVGANPNGLIYANEGRVSESIGYVSANVAIGDFEWDVINNTFKVPIYHIVNTANSFTVKFKILSHSETAQNIKNNITISPQYSRTAIVKNFVHFNNNVGIGTTTPTEKLSVNGNIRAKKIIVTQSGWADYVFSKDYKLKPLIEVEKFIQNKKRLPETPSAAEIEEKGINVGDNQALLLKKIEELTLYLIEMNKRVAKLEYVNKLLLNKHLIKKQN